MESVRMTIANPEVITNPPGNPNPNPGAGDPPGEPNPPEMVSREEFERVQADMHKFKDAARAANASAEALKLQGLKAKEDYKAIAEDFEKKYSEAVKERDQIRTAIVSDKKMSAIKLEAKKAGILDTALEDLELVDFPEVNVETTSTGRMNVLGVERAIQRLKTSRAHWFGKSAPNVNPGTPGVSLDGKVTYEEFTASENAARKSGDWSAHKALVARYKAQK